jgi:hypothetical protein
MENKPVAPVMIPAASPTRKDLNKMDYLVKSMK